MAAGELETYGRILKLAHSLSTEREVIKAQQLLALLDEHDQVVAFDSRPITLAYIAKILLPDDVYRHYRHVTAPVVSRVRIVKAAQPWAFFCVSGTRIGAPHWVLIDRAQTEPLTQLKEIVEELRSRLTPATENRAFDERAAFELYQMLTRLALVERKLLPRRKQRALEEMERVLGRYLKSTLLAQDEARHKRLQRILAVFTDEYRSRGVDWDNLAERWLELVRPAWYARLLVPKRTRPLPASRRAAQPDGVTNAVIGAEPAFYWSGTRSDTPLRNLHIEILRCLYTCGVRRHRRDHHRVIDSYRPQNRTRPDNLTCNQRRLETTARERMQ